MTEAALHIRPAALDDARLLWQWRNAPDVRAASLDTTPIPFEGHLRWFEAALADPTRDILIAEQEGQSIGMVRFDEDGDIASVNVLIDPKARGQGLAKTVLAEAIAKTSITSSRLRATVKANNVASLALFRGLGFEEVSAGAVYVFERDRAG